MAMWGASSFPLALALPCYGRPRLSHTHSLAGLPRAVGAASWCPDLLLQCWMGNPSSWYLINVYCGGWVHFFKNHTLPPAVVPANATHPWVAKCKPVIEALLAHCVTISPSTLIQNASEALASAAGAGFSHAVEDAQRPLPAWKGHNYARLLQVLGIMHWPTSRAALLANTASQPWGGPSREPQAPLAQARALELNPTFPLSVTRVYIPSDASKSYVGKLGQLH